MLCIFSNYAAQHEGQWRWECKMIAIVQTLDTDNALLLLSLAAWLGGWFCHLTHWRRWWCRCRRWSCPLLASLSESCHDMYCLGSVTTACCCSRNWPRCTLHYSSQLHCTVCTAPVHSVQGDTGSVHQLSTARSKVWCVQIPATRHRRPMTWSSIMPIISLLLGRKLQIIWVCKAGITVWHSLTGSAGLKFTLSSEVWTSCGWNETHLLT